MNRCTTSVAHKLTPHKKYYGKKPDLSHVRIFGSIAYVNIPDEKWQKLDPKLEKCILVGYSLRQKGYKLLNPSTQKVRISRDVVFEGSTSWYEHEPTPPEPFLVDLDDTEDNDQLRSIPEESPVSTRLSKPQEPSSNRSTSQPSPKMDKGKAKMPKYEDQDDNESTHFAQWWVWRLMLRLCWRME